MAWVSTVTEKPSTPEVFLQVGYTWYLEEQEKRHQGAKTEGAVMRCSHMGGLTHPRVSLVRRKSKHGSSICICRQTEEVEKLDRQTGKQTDRQTD